MKKQNVSQQHKQFSTSTFTWWLLKFNYWYEQSGVVGLHNLTVKVLKLNVLHLQNTANTKNV